jgi:hypothetical protein
MLHIVTSLYYTEYLESVYNSIYMDPDIRWHIGKSKEQEMPTNSFLKSDKRIIVYDVDCANTEPHKKRNAALDNIKDGYFCFLDDDTIFHENMYLKYRQSMENNFVGMLVGEQLDPKGNLRLIASKPVYERIDTGNVLSHHSSLQNVRWVGSHIEGVNSVDFLFWNEVYEFFGKKCAISNTPISHYNKLSGRNDFVIRRKR